MSYIEVDVNGKALFKDEQHRISVLRCCEEWCSPNKKKERRVREYYSLHFVIGGKGTLVYEYGGERHEVVLQKGDSFLLYAKEKYEYCPDSNRHGAINGLILQEKMQTIYSPHADMTRRSRLFRSVILIVCVLRLVSLLMRTT